MLTSLSIEVLGTEIWDAIVRGKGRSRLQHYREAWNSDNVFHPTNFLRWEVLLKSRGVVKTLDRWINRDPDRHREREREREREYGRRNGHPWDRSDVGAMKNYFERGNLQFVDLPPQSWTLKFS